MSCNKDCFNCVHPDCIVEDVSADEYKQQQELDNQIKDEVAGNERRTRYLKDKSKNIEEHRRKAREYYYANREKCLKNNREYYNAHKEYYSSRYKEYAKTHPRSKEKKHEYYIRWRDKKRAKEKELKENDNERNVRPNPRVQKIC